MGTLRDSFTGDSSLPGKHDRENELSDQEKLAISLGLSGVATWWHDLLNNEIFWSDSMFILMGVEKITPMTVDYAIQVMTDEALEMTEQNIIDTHQFLAHSDERSHATQAMHINQKTSNGEIRHIVNQWQSINNKQGQEVLRVGYIRDETELVRAQKKLEKLVLTDSLTNIANRRSYEQRLQEEVSNAKRSKQALSCLMIDVDYFKPYNDNYGHDNGDVALKSIAHVISKALPRDTDFVARYGGEEFIVLLPATDLDGAIYVAKCINANIKATAISHAYSEVLNVVTVSIGVATLQHDEVNPVDLIKNADIALYEAKKTGRDRHIVFN